MSLLDFGGSSYASDICHAYAILREYNPTATSTICSGPDRERQIYVSQSHSLELRILTDANRAGTNLERNFIFKYNGRFIPYVNMAVLKLDHSIILMQNFKL